MDNHVSFPFVLVVAGAEDRNKCKDDPREKEDEPVDKVNVDFCLYVLALKPKLGNVRLEVVLMQSLHTILLL